MYTRNALGSSATPSSRQLGIETSLGVSGAACSELSEPALVKFVIGGARTGLTPRFNRPSLYAASAKLAPKLGVTVAAMGVPPVAKTDLRPWRSNDSRSGSANNSQHVSSPLGWFISTACPQPAWRQVALLGER
jgi:hypothetical protein